MEAQNLTQISSKVLLSFSWIDYTLFCLMFGLSAVIGVYYGCFGNKQSTTKDYLHGGKKMKIFPVAMSLIASNLSGISLLGIPAEIYMHGTQYLICMLAAITLTLIVNYLYLPVFYTLQLNSTYEYLKLRFSNRICLIASILFVISTLLYLPIVIYVPALAFSQVTGLDIYLITPIVSFVCIFYTTLGGLKAVVWTDTLQFSVTLSTLAFVLVMGTISVGGFKSVWNKSNLGDRIEFFNMDLNPTLRASFWSVLIGQTVNWMSVIGCNPAMIQRFMALPTMKAAKTSAIIFAVGVIVTKAISGFSGLIMFAKYYDCDPLTSGYIKKSDQILPYYVLDVASEIPGISGLFVAGVFSTALSTLSTYLNTLSGIVYTDFMAPFMPKDISESKINKIMKLNAVIMGILSVSLVFVVEKLGSVLELNISLSGVTAGPLLGLFTMGMVFPMANEKGAIYGSLGSLLIVGWLVIKIQFYNYSGAISHQPKPLNTYGCDAKVNITSFTTPSIITTSSSLYPEEDPIWLFKLSFYYYTLIGTALTFIIGLPVSWFTRSPNDPIVDPNLLCPFLQKSLKTTSTKYTTVEKALRTINRDETEKDALNSCKI